MTTRNRNLLIIVVGGLLLLCCYCAVVTSLGAVLILRPASRQGPQAVAITRIVTAAASRQATRTPAPVQVSTPRPSQSKSATATPPGALSTSAVPVTAQPKEDADAEDAALLADEMPAANKRELALRLNPNTTDIPTVVNTAAPGYKIGDKGKFWISNSDTQQHKEITAELKYMTPHVAMWVEEGLGLSQRNIEASARRFEEETYPTNREFFGSEWTPGVDNDPRLHVLHAEGLGSSVAGYYTSADEYSKLVNKYSNEREMFYVAAEEDKAMKPGSDFYDGVLAHEFQHMIHWANDANETSWVNEGMSELASYLNGYDPGGQDFSYAQQPDTQLTTWADLNEGNSEHYGASYLFMSYFLDRYGEDLTKAVVASPLNGIPSFNEALQKAGETEQFEDVFADWVVANYLDAPDADPEGRYGYSDIDTYPIAVAESIRKYPASDETTVSQYGADYIRLRARSSVTIQFDGATQASLVDAEPQGNHSWWSNRGDLSASTLTRSFDLREVKAATLTFSAWYDIEDGYDYAYVEVSTDGGKRWQILPARHTTTENPVGNAFGPGWTGTSGGGDQPKWVDEVVNLTPFAGKEVLVRFELITDDAVNEPGLLIDNIAIAEIGYNDAGEAGPADWSSEGWVLTDNSVRQRWLVQLIQITDDTVSVTRMEVGPDGRGELQVPEMKNASDAILVVSAMAPVTTEKASYKYTITQN